MRQHFQLFDLELRFPKEAYQECVHTRVKALSAEQAIAHAYAKIRATNAVGIEPLKPIHVQVMG